LGPEGRLPITQRILVVDDDLEVVRSLSRMVVALGYGVEGASTVEGALSIVRSRPPRLLLLDRRLADEDGLEVLAEMRGSELTVPVIVVSAVDQPVERANALKLGADDYVVKPFYPDELRERVQAVIRRCRPVAPADAGSELVFVPEALSVRFDGRQVRLSKILYELLRTLDEADGELVSRPELLRRVWQKQQGTATNCVAVGISRLREALGPRGDWIEWARGGGYRLARRC